MPNPWDPTVYLAFADHRGRPFYDLLSRVNAANPRRVVDLGCGPGNLTVSLDQRWPDAVIEAVDSSPEMVAAARERGVDAVVGDLADWSPKPETDVVLSNAALQWLPNHVDLLVRWADELAPGSWIAFQVPGNFDAPSHRAVREAAHRAPFANSLSDLRFSEGKIVETPVRYAEILTEAGCTVDTWETTYIHELSGETPVLGWISGTALTEVKSRLSPEAYQQYEQQLMPLLVEAYPPRPDGRTFFPFRRIFVVAQLR
jgi:trans-aconitate 2-methyltransferase